MWKTGFTYFFIASISFLIVSCVQESEPPVNQAIEGSNEVLSIPVKRRWKEFNEGNKVFNASFEQGKVFNNNFHTFEINRWSKVGSNITWVDTDDEEFSKSDVSSGKHAVKITNKSRYESGEDKTGILSDYIKVLNGNYRLSYDIKLKNICPYNSRFGSRLIDAVNIRIFYYDKNKIKLEGQLYDPQQKKYIDNEFKALPFSGFWKIDSLGWIRSKGITCKFPFPDGDIPEETKYVRIFFGLKGSGTIWVDNVNLQYTKQNFSVKEYLKPYKDSVFSETDLLLPTPKHVKTGEKYTLFEPDKKTSNPLIVIPSKASWLTYKAAKQLKNKLLQISRETFSNEERKIEIKKNVSPEDLKDCCIAFSVGNNSLNRTFKTQSLDDSIEHHKEGYFIKKAGNKTPVICIKGSSDKGNYYGIQTICQLFDKNKGIYHHADIIDYPDFAKRGIVFKNQNKPLKNEKLTNQYRFTHHYTSFHGDQSLSQIKESFENRTGSPIENSLVKPGLLINPYRIYNDKNSFLKQPEIPHLNKVLNLMSQLQSEGVRDFIINIDNTFSVKESCLCIFHVESGQNHIKYRSLLDVHKDMINKIAENLEEDTQISFMPIWNNTECIRKSQGKGELYLKELFRKIPERVHYLWTGASSKPYLVDETEIMYVKNIIGKKPVFYCNDIHPFSDDAKGNAYAQNYPGKLRTSSIFQQMNLNTPGNFNKITAGQTFIGEVEYSNSLDDIKLACFSDYLWNSKKYDSNLSLLKTLISEYGKNEAFALIEFNDIYKGLQEMLIKINKLESTRKYIRSAEDFISKLDNHMKKLEKLFSGKAILKDLQKKEKKLKQQFEGMVG